MRIVLLVCVVLISLGQSFSINIDSLENELKFQEGTKKVKILNDLCWELGGVNVEKAKMYGQQAIVLSKNLNNDTLLAQAFNDYGTLFLRMGLYDSALQLYNKSLLIRKKLNDSLGISSIISKQAVICELKGDYKMALEKDLEVLSIYEKQKNWKNVCLLKNNIAIIYYNLNQNKLAKKFNNQALKIAENLKSEHSIFLIMSAFGNIAVSESKHDSAIYFFEKSLSYIENTSDNNNKSIIYNNLANEYLTLNNIEKSKYYLLKSLEIRKTNNDIKGMASSYSILSLIKLKENNLDSAIFYNNLALDYALKTKTKENIKNAYNNFVSIYSQKNDWKKVSEYQMLYMQVKDSIFNESFSKQIAEMEAKYESAKKDKEIAVLNKDNEIAQVNLDKQTTQKYAFAGGFVLLLCLTFIVYRSYRDKKHSNKIITQKNEELSIINEEILAQKDKISNQKQIIEEKHNDLQSSVNYAYKIQIALLSAYNNLSDAFNDYFILFKPRDVVSGDFYWSFKNEKVTIWAVGDCTGHGVPGAFMSVLAISFLNEIVVEQKVFKPSEILNLLRDKIIKTLSNSQQNESFSIKDGLDISLCMFNKVENTMFYSCANNPLFIIRKNECIELKPDKQPIGKLYEKSVPFTNNQVEFYKGDLVYLFSDGYQDQFGGKENKKFMKKQLKKVFLEISDLDIIDQKIKLDNIVENWKKEGNTVQTDDICIVGVKL